VHNNTAHFNPLIGLLHSAATGKCRKVQTIVPVSLWKLAHEFWRGTQSTGMCAAHATKKKCRLLCRYCFGSLHKPRLHISSIHCSFQLSKLLPAIHRTIVFVFVPWQRFPPQLGTACLPAQPVLARRVTAAAEQIAATARSIC
jgi:hypothetical protein